MLNFGRPLVGLTAEEWGDVIEALRFAAHTEPDEAYLGLEQERAHLAAEKIARQIDYGVACMACEVEKEIGEDEAQTPAADDHTPAAEGILAARAEAWVPGTPDPAQAAMDQHAETEIEKAEGHTEPEESCEGCK